MVSRLISVVALGTLVAAGAQASVVDINFDGTGAPCVFASTSPLTNLYAGQGVNFSGANGGGGSILNQCGNFGFDARSGTDFYAYNTGAGTGSIFDMSFSSAVESVSIWGASGRGGSVTLEAFDASNVSLGSSSITASNQWQQLSVSSSGIARARLSVQTEVGAFDDLRFDTDGQQVPEPATLALVALGLLGAAAGCRRRA